MEKINNIRKKINAIDKKILQLLNQRAEETVEIGRLKNSSGKAVYVPSREADIIGVLCETNNGPLSREQVSNIFKEIISSCRSLESKLRISYLGPQGTFSHQAAVKKFGLSAEYVPCETITDVILAVEKNIADFAVIPVENSTEGSVNMSLDMLVDTNLNVISEINLKVQQCLLSKCKMADIKTVYSHQQPLAQCGIWLKKNLPNAKVVAVNSTAEASMLAFKNKNSAAIASEVAAGIYNLNIIAKSIEDSRNNWTRFFVLGNIFTSQSKKDKTSIIFTIKDKVSTLYHILSIFSKAGVNLTKVESRPTKKRAWEYIFFIDFNGHINDKKIMKVLDEVKNNTLFLKVLGSYPQAAD